MTRDLLTRIDDVERLFEAREPSIQAFLPEEGRFDRLRRQAIALADRYPDPAARPPLFGFLFGVKDIFHVDGWATHAGSRVPAAALSGPQGDAVTRLLEAGALMAGKTVTTEFAYFTPGPTRNPHNVEHTPGGSSSGSAAAVAAGMCDFALGTQTIGSIVRPASFCGIVGVKPTFNRIPATGIVACAPSLDHVGVLAPDVAMAARASRVLYTTWADPGTPVARPVLGIPEGPYLQRVPPDTSAWFTRACDAIARDGYELKRVPIMRDFDAVVERHQVILAAEAAGVHAAWFRDYESLYGDKMAALVRRGQSITPAQLEAARAGQAAFREDLGRTMRAAGIDAWICPSTLGPAPRGLDTTGDPVMNLPWTQAGLPVVGLPGGRLNGLPMGLQLVGCWSADELLLARARAIERVIA